MASVDDQFVVLISNIRQTLVQLRIVDSIGGDNNPNFLPGKGESIYATFLRVVGLLRYSEAVNSNIPTEQRVAEGKNIVDRLLKPKDANSERRKENIIKFLDSLQQQLEKYVRDVGLVSLRRIRKQIGNATPNPRNDSLKTTVSFSTDIAANIRTVNQQLAKYDLQRDSIGQLVQEIDLLALFLQNLNAVVNDVVSGGTSPDRIPAQPLGPMGGPLASMIQAQAQGYQQRLDSLVNRRVALNANLLTLQKKMRLIRTGLELVNKEPIALLSIVNALTYMFKEIKFTCHECRFFSTTPLEGQVDLASLTPDQRAAEQARIAQANERSTKFRQSLGSEPGFCTYRVANVPTSSERSCNEVWGLVDNGFWRASDNDQQGRIDIISKARDKLDPRKK